MDNAFVSAISALAGSAIGGLATFATTWLANHAQTNAQRLAQAMARQEHLYGRFIDEAAKSITDALTHELDDPSKLVRLYALVGKLRLFASANVVSQAEEVMQRIVETYNLPNRDFNNPEDRRRQDADLLRAFSEACREDLRV
jgi:hypothetical protein